MPTPSEEAARRRTFAIISHPDAGKTTLTEKFLLYGGAVQSAGAVKARGERRRVTSDWMEMEQKRGISITSTVLQFPYRDHVLNLLDTPGHRDFSEDTYRVLAAADAAIMVLDAAKGIEPQTLKLFEVCRERDLPLLTFINKWDRPGPRAPRAARPDRARSCRSCRRRSPGRSASPATSAAWSTGATTATCASPARPAAPPRRGEEVLSRRRGRRRRGRRRGRAAADELELLDDAHGLDDDRFRKGEVSPVFFGSALTNFGVRLLLDAVVDLAPSPQPRDDTSGVPAPARRAVLRLRLQGAGEHGPEPPRPHRLRARVLGPVRAGDGRHPRPHRQAVRHQVRPLGVRPGARHDRGGVAGRRDRPRQRHGRHASATPSTSTPPVEFPRLPEFAPEHFQVARVKDTGRFKQFRRGIAQLDEEGVVQVLRDPDLGDQAPMLAAVGPMQFEVAVHRLENEFGAPDRAERHLVARGPAHRRGVHARSCGRCRAWRCTSAPTAPATRCSSRRYWLARVEGDHPELVLEKLVAEGTVGLAA